MSAADILGWFPNLKYDDLILTSPKTPTYNCIAYAAGDTGKWWWPDSFGIGYWPPNVPRVNKLPAFQAAFESLGYSLHENGNHEIGLEKIAVFAKENGEPTHACRQLQDGNWVSKLGKEEDVIHSLSGIDGSGVDPNIYGSVAFFMSRPFSTLL